MNRLTMACGCGATLDMEAWSSKAIKTAHERFSADHYACRTYQQVVEMTALNNVVELDGRRPS